MLWMVNLYGNDTSVLMYGYASSIKQMSNIPLDIHLMVEDTKRLYRPIYCTKSTFYHNSL